MLVDRALADCRQRLRARSRQGTGCVGVHRHERDITLSSVNTLIDQVHHRVRRWVLNRVIGHVAKVTLVAESVTGAQSRFPVSTDVPGKSETRTKVLVIRIPEHAAVLGKLHLAVTDLIEDGRALAQ